MLNVYGLSHQGFRIWVLGVKVEGSGPLIPEPDRNPKPLRLSRPALGPQANNLKGMTHWSEKRNIHGLPLVVPIRSLYYAPRQQALVT